MEPSKSNKKSVLSVLATIWGHAPAGPVPSKTPRDLSRRLGGLNRSCPTGGSAYGIPPKDSTLFFTLPRMVAEGRMTVAVPVARSSRCCSVGEDTTRAALKTAKRPEIRDSMMKTLKMIEASIA